MQRLLDLLGSRYPIIQGPIGAMNGPRLVSAISEAGGFGMLALGFSGPDDVRRMVAEVRELTDKPFGANLMIMNPANKENLEVLAAAGVGLVTTSAGSPKKIFPDIHALGMKGLHVLLSLPHALAAEEAGADGLVVCGAEAGGLRSVNPESSTMVLVPLVVDHVKIPVVAAGGIADGRGYRAALALGAQGVQVGTRFIATEESPAPKAWKDAIVNCSDGGTTLLPLGRMTMRTIMNEKLKALMSDPKADLAAEYNYMNAGKAWTTGDFDLFPAGSGDVAALVRDIKPAAAVIREMVSQG
jgi:enoyl-[acyl-carrier protein] reductase II